MLIPLILSRSVTYNPTSGLRLMSAPQSVITDHEFGERAGDNHGEFSTYDRFFLLFIFIFLQFKCRHDKTPNGVTWETDLETFLFLVEVWLIDAVQWIAKWPVSPLKSFSWPKFIIILNPSSQLRSEHLCSLSYFLIAYVKQSKWISSECSLYYSELLNSISRVRKSFRLCSHYTE